MTNPSQIIMAESLVNEIMDAQADEACEAGNRRNGHREHRFTTTSNAKALMVGCEADEAVRGCVFEGGVRRALPNLK